MLGFSIFSSNNSHATRVNRISLAARPVITKTQTPSILSALQPDTVHFSGPSKIDKDTVVSTAEKWIELTEKTREKNKFHQAVWGIAQHIKSIVNGSGVLYDSNSRYEFYRDKVDYGGARTHALCVTSTNPDGYAAIELLSRASWSSRGCADGVLTFAENELRKQGFDRVYVTPKSEHAKKYFDRKGYRESDKAGMLVKELSQKAQKSPQQQGESHAKSSATAGIPLQRTGTQEGEWSKVSYYYHSGTNIPHSGNDYAVGDRVVNGIRRAYKLDTHQDVGLSRRNWQILPPR